MPITLSSKKQIISAKFKSKGWWINIPFTSLPNDLLIVLVPQGSQKAYRFLAIPGNSLNQMNHGTIRKSLNILLDNKLVDLYSKTIPRFSFNWYLLNK